MEAVSHGRWKRAQAAEGFYWTEASRDLCELLRITHEKVAAVKWALECRDALVAQDGALVEIGIGPLGVGCIHFLPSETVERRSLIGIDPLGAGEGVRDALRSLPKPLSAMIEECRSERFRQIVGVGEKIDLPDACAAFVVCYNVLDHCQDPGTVLREISRILKSDSCLLLGCDTYSLAGLVKHRIRSSGAAVLNIKLGSIGDEAHPFQFLPWDLERLVKEAGLTVMHTNRRQNEYFCRVWSHSYRMLMVVRKP